ncbi:hypothetical protein DFH28DRAFT_988405 [Melampsora americana]|nr:hypothetical protein DFH28DRAFT_988405 [Melampsora americana]
MMENTDTTICESPAYVVPFARSVLSLLSIWPALELSFEHSSRRSEKSILISELATELVGAFLDSEVEKPPSTEELEDFLLGWCFGTLDVRIEDDSELTVSKELLGLWKEWTHWTGTVEAAHELEGTLIHRIEKQAERKRLSGSRIQATVVDEGAVESGESDDDDDDDRMDVEPVQNQPTRSRPKSPVVDEDGFTLVTKHSHPR